MREEGKFPLKGEGKGLRVFLGENRGLQKYASKKGKGERGAMFECSGEKKGKMQTSTGGKRTGRRTQRERRAILTQKEGGKERLLLNRKTTIRGKKEVVRGSYSSGKERSFIHLQKTGEQKKPIVRKEKRHYSERKEKVFTGELESGKGRKKKGGSYSIAIRKGKRKGRKKKMTII